MRVSRRGAGQTSERTDNVRILRGFRAALLWVGAMLGGFSAIVFLLGMLFGVRAQIVQSGSMAPDLPVGALLAVRTVPADELVIGDVVTVDRPSGRGLVTHRVVGIAPASGGAVSLRLKGDANAGEDPDPYLVSEVGKKVLAVPGLGTLAALLQTRSGFAVAAGGTAVLLVASWAIPPRRRDEAPEPSTRR